MKNHGGHGGKRRRTQRRDVRPFSVPSVFLCALHGSVVHLRIRKTKSEWKGRAVTLEEVLANRDRRVLLQREALGAFQRPVLSVSLVMPGPVKDSPEARLLMDSALGALELLLEQRRWPILSLELRLDPTGPEALLVVDAEALGLKGAVAQLEEEHPLGRLWDLDVICPEGASISRRALGLPPRRCLLCGEAAHACARSRAHPLAELLGAIRQKILAHGAGEE